MPSNLLTIKTRVSYSFEALTTSDINVSQLNLKIRRIRKFKGKNGIHIRNAISEHHKKNKSLLLTADISFKIPEGSSKEEIDKFIYNIFTALTLIEGRDVSAPLYYTFRGRKKIGYRVASSRIGRYTENMQIFSNHSEFILETITKLRDQEFLDKTGIGFALKPYIETLLEVGIAFELKHLMFQISLELLANKHYQNERTVKILQLKEENSRMKAKYQRNLLNCIEGISEAEFKNRMKGKIETNPLFWEPNTTEKISVMLEDLNIEVNIRNLQKINNVRINITHRGLTIDEPKVTLYLQGLVERVMFSKIGFNLNDTRFFYNTPFFWKPNYLD